jgi:hypothetical protein
MRCKPFQPRDILILKTSAAGSLVNGNHGKPAALRKQRAADRCINSMRDQEFIEENIRAQELGGKHAIRRGDRSKLEGGESARRGIERRVRLIVAQERIIDGARAGDESGLGCGLIEFPQKRTTAVEIAGDELDGALQLCGITCASIDGVDDLALFIGIVPGHCRTYGVSADQSMPLRKMCRHYSNE